MRSEPLIYEISSEGRHSQILPGTGEEKTPAGGPFLPEVSEIDLVRHFINLSRNNFGVDTGFYPLGSCTMKYNPKINEETASLAGFTGVHPLEPDGLTQGTLELLFDLERYLCAIFGFDSFTLSPSAGAHGELTAALMIKKYFASRNEPQRKKILIPDSAHGTNPSSAVLAGFEIVSIRSNKNGEVDLDDLKRLTGNDTALLMLTNPNTLGLFDRNILDIANIVHSAGAKFYMDGANANALLCKVRPSDLGFDIAHLNLHKTFATPHGGGGPGSGPVGVTKELEPYLPGPRITRERGRCALKEGSSGRSIGKVSAFHGNIGVLIKAYAYIRSLGAAGLKRVSENAVLNANYVMSRLKGYYDIPFDRTCQHEFVISAKRQKQKNGVRALDIAKRLIDYGFHPPTIYFPLIVDEALMIEPTETESKETLDRFADAMIAIARECEKDPELVKSAPHTTPVGRLDEVRAVKDLNVCYKG